MLVVSRKQSELRERRGRVFELRRAGATYREIAQTLGADIATVHRDYRAAVGELLPVDAVEDVRRTEEDRLDAVRLALWKGVKSGDVKSIDRYLAVCRVATRTVSVEAEIRRLVQSLRSAPVSTAFEARAALAFALAQTIDGGAEGKPAPVAKELRALITELLAEVGDIDNDAFGDVLQAKVRDSAES